MWTLGWEKLLQLSALVLSVVNGLILLRVHLRDRARLQVFPVHPDSYQWWFRGPAGMHAGNPTRRFGFVVYAGIRNKGYRAVSFDRWRLEVRAKNNKRAELRALNMPEPRVALGEILKVIPVLGQKGTVHSGEMRVEPGDSTSGMALYVYECFGSEAWDPAITDRRIDGRFTLWDVFGGSARSDFQFQERTIEQIEQLLPGVNALFAAVDAGWGPKAG
jgi:hypothetical protein